MLINAGLGGTQAFFSGGSTYDIIEATIFGGIVGRLGGQGWQSQLHFWNRLHYRDAVQAISKGLWWGMGGTVADDRIDVIEPMLDFFDNEESRGVVCKFSVARHL